MVPAIINFGIYVFTELKMIMAEKGYNHPYKEKIPMDIMII